MTKGKWIGLGAAVMAVAAGSLVLLFTMPQTLPVGVANGRYANGCCGTVQLGDGRMTLDDGRTVAYAVKADAHGPYILPASAVAIADGHRLTVRPDTPPIKLRLDDSVHPGTLALLDSGRNRLHIFVRQAPAAH